MLKEILEQPRVIADCLAGRVDKETATAVLPELEDTPVPERLYIVACGTSYHAGLWGMTDTPLADRLIVALDVPTTEAALSLVDILAPKVRFYKVGLQLFLAGGFAVCDAITARGCRVMLDLKFHDIPQTVTRSMEQMADHDIALTTVHGYPQVVEAAAKAKGRTKVLAVTVLTSLGGEELRQTGFAGDLADLVRLRAVTSLAAGADGLVCSPLEVAVLRKHLGAKPIIATPGIRLLDSARDDQIRTATPLAAIHASVRAAAANVTADWVAGSRNRSWQRTVPVPARPSSSSAPRAVRPQTLYASATRADSAQNPSASPAHTRDSRASS